MTREELVDAGTAALRMAGIRINLYKTEDDAVETVLNAIEPLIRADEAAKSREVIEALASEVMGLRTHWTPPEDSPCSCWNCNPAMHGRRMFACADCGNKRCPRATSHANQCSDSNDPNQPSVRFDGPYPFKFWAPIDEAQA